MSKGQQIAVRGPSDTADRPSHPFDRVPLGGNAACCRAFWGVTATNGYHWGTAGAEGAPYPRAPRRGPRPFSISVVNSFGGSFVWMLKPWIAHPAARSTRLGPRSRGCCGSGEFIAYHINSGEYCYIMFGSVSVENYEP